MNSIKVFHRIEKETDDDKVGDVIAGLLHINEGVFYGKDIECVQELKDEAIHTKHSNDYCYCFFGIDSEHNQGSFTEEQKIKMREMGEYALIITDFPEFIHRIANVINGLNYELYGGFVTYYNPKVDSVNILISLLGKDSLLLWSSHGDDIIVSFGGGVIMNGIKYFSPTNTSGPDGYINYKMSGGDKLGSGGGQGCGFIGWIFIVLIVLWVIGKLFGQIIEKSK